MNRLIKFRAWHEQGKIIEWEVLKYTADCGAVISGGYAPYKPMLYAGFKDSDGKEVYEGDILEFSTKEYTCFMTDDDEPFHPKEECCGYYEKVEAKKWTQVQEWKDDHAGFSIRKFDLEPYKHYPEADFRAIVVGNIYENPELLK